MFTIDLLKGSGIPVKSGPAGVALAVITAVMPAVVAIAIFVGYLNNKIMISVERDKIAGFEKKIESSEFERTMKVQELLNHQKQTLQNSLAEVSTVIGGHTQWTPVLETIVKNMPEQMVLTAIEVKNESRKVRKAKEDNPEKTIEIAVLVRILHMSLAGNLQHNYDRAVRDFRDSLMYDEVLGPKLEEIRVAQEFSKLEGQEVVSHEMFLVFKPLF